MKFSENDNIYEVNALNVLGKYAEFVEGTPDCMVGVCYGALTGETLSDGVRKAIAASCDKLELGECAWVAVGGLTDSLAAGFADELVDGTASDGTTSGDTVLGGTTSGGLLPEDLLELIEGLDPVVLIAIDKAAANALGEAYSCTVPLDARSRIFGRTCVAFRSFENMLADSDAKQRAWALLKQLK